MMTRASLTDRNSVNRVIWHFSRPSIKSSLNDWNMRISFFPYFKIIKHSYVFGDAKNSSLYPEFLFFQAVWLICIELLFSIDNYIWIMYKYHKLQHHIMLDSWPRLPYFIIKMSRTFNFKSCFWENSWLTLKLIN